MSYWDASRCQPIGDPGRYSLISAMAKASASTPAHSASAARSGNKKAGNGAVGGAIVRLAEESDPPTCNDATHLEVRKRDVGDRVEERPLLGVGDDVVAIVEACRQVVLEEAWRSGHAPSVP